MPLAKRIKFLSLSMALAMCQGSALAEPVVVVSAKSSISSLSSSQLMDIFLGKTSQFPNGEPVTPIDQPEGSDTRDEFYSRYFNKSPAQIRAYWSKIIFTGKGQPPREVPNTERVKKKLAENPEYISYVDRAALDPNLKVVVVTKP